MKILNLILLLCLTQNLIAQNCGDFKNFPTGENSAKAIFQEFTTLLDSQEYKKALDNWSTLYNYAPSGHRLMYAYGDELYTTLIEIETNPQQIKVYQQKVYDIYENRLTCLCPILRDSGQVMESMAIAFSMIDYEDLNVTLSAYQKAIEINNNETSAFVLAYYADHVLWMYENDLLDEKTVKDVYKTLEGIKNANSDDVKYLESWQYVEEYYEPIFPVRTFDCNLYEMKFRMQYELYPDDKARIKSMLSELRELDCNEIELIEELEKALDKH